MGQQKPKTNRIHLACIGDLELRKLLLHDVSSCGCVCDLCGYVQGPFVQEHVSILHDLSTSGAMDPAAAAAGCPRHNRSWAAVPVSTRPGVGDRGSHPD